jgi:Yip1-like protein
MANGAGSPTAGLGNPFFTIWIAPRATIRRIVDTDPTRHVLILAALGPALFALYGQWSKAVGDNANLSVLWPVWVVVGVAIQAALGILGLYISGVLFRWSGSLLGGTASRVEVRAAFAWSQIPSIGTVLILFAALSMGIPVPQVTPGHLPRIDPAFYKIMALIAALSFWGLVIHLKCLGEVHRFSAWKALGTLLIPALIFVIGSIAIVSLLGRLIVLHH